MKRLIIDLSPVLYGNLFSATNEAKRIGIKKDENDNYLFHEYRDIFVFKVMEELGSLKFKFGADEVIIAVDSVGYWRKDVWAGYKHKRKDARDKSNVDWQAARPAMDEIINVLDTMTSFNVVDVPKAEGDDVVFVLSDYLAKLDSEVVIYSSDHDFIQCLEHPNVQFWRTTRTKGMQNSAFYEAEPGELVHIILDHVIGGDSGDGIHNVKGYSRFSKKFNELYPNKSELVMWDKRFELDQMFTKKYGESAYNHPRYGYKMFMKTKKTVEELLAEDPIFEKNYLLNRQIALPEGIPTELSSKIINNYNLPKTSDKKELNAYFKANGMFELTGKIASF